MAITGNIELTKKVPLELLCLLLLEERDMYGYEMISEIKKRSGGVITINITTLYLALKRLDENGYISTYYADTGGMRERSRIYYRFEAPAAAYKEKLYSNYQEAVNGVQRFFDYKKG